MLRITRQTDYAIVLTARLASGEAKSVHNARDLATFVHLPLPTVSKILKAMARAGLLTSHRGVKGGYSLARDPKQITLADVIEVLEGPIAITECLDEGTDECNIECTCPTRANWKRANAAVRNVLAAIPLSEMTTVQFPPLERAEI